MVYLDSAATTLQKPKSVFQAVYNAQSMTSPGRGNYNTMLRASKTVLDCRELAAKLFNVPSPEQVVITFNATHGLNTAINALVQNGAKVTVSGFEHNAVMRPLYARNAEITVARNTKSPFGVVDWESFIHDDTDCVIVNHISNVFGNEQDIYTVSKICSKKGIPLIVDASQSAGIVPIDFQALNADYIAMPGHKSLYGPQGTGLLLVKSEGSPLLYGGTGSDSVNHDMPEFLPDRFEAGTHNMPGIAGLTEGLRFVLKTGIDNISLHELSLINLITEKLSVIPKVRIYAPGQSRNVLSFKIDDIDCELIGEILSSKGFAVRTGLHCAPLAHETGNSDGTVRVSVSAFNTKREIIDFVKAIKQISSI